MLLEAVFGFEKLCVLMFESCTTMETGEFRQGQVRPSGSRVRSGLAKIIYQ
jgi:hypothetical protein